MNQEVILNQVKKLETQLETIQVAIIKLQNLNEQVKQLQVMINEITSKSIVNLTNNLQQIQTFIKQELPKEIYDGMQEIRSLWGL